MAVSASVSEGGARGGGGLHLGVVREESVKTLIRLAIGSPVCQVKVEECLERKLSHPLFMDLPEPAGCARVALDTWPNFLARQFLLVWESSWMMRRLDLVGVIEGVESVTTAAAYELGVEAFLSAVKRGFISA